MVQGGGSHVSIVGNWNSYRDGDRISTVDHWDSDSEQISIIGNWNSYRNGDAISTLDHWSSNPDRNSISTRDH